MTPNLKRWPGRSAARASSLPSNARHLLRFLHGKARILAVRSIAQALLRGRRDRRPSRPKADALPHLPLSTSHFRTPTSSLQPTACSLSPTSAFTLVEVALAALVISLGLLALVGLGRLAMQNAKDAEDDTRAAWLADDVFATLRATNDVLCAANDPGAWAAFWSSFTNNGASIVLTPAPGFSNAFSNAILGNGQENTNVVCSCGTPAITEWSACFSLDTLLTNSYSAISVQDAALTHTPNELRVTLHVRPGAYHTNALPRTFYTHFTEHGALP